MRPETIVGVYVFAIGAFIGSFLNVLIYRIPRRENFVTGRSHCPSCGIVIRWYDNVPLLSFLILHGKCRNCKAWISWRYPVVELLTALFFLLAFSLYGISTQALLCGVFFALLLVVTFIDFQYYIIPDKITYPGIVLGLAFSFFSPLVTPFESIVGLVVGGGTLYLLAMTGDYILKKESLGGGDIKLAAMLGAFLGWKNVFIILFAAAVLGLIYALSRMAIARRSQVGRMIPFGPFLSMAGLLALFFGNLLVDYDVHEILALN